MIKQIRSAAGKYWQAAEDLELKSVYDTSRKAVVVDTKREFQQLIGFGGAFTESSGYCLSLLSENERARVVAAYFGKEGLGYTLGRMHMNSSDFSLGNYTYVQEGDGKLKGFDVSREEKYVLPFIAAAGAAAGRKIKLLVSPWSPPPFFKTNNSMNYGGRLKAEYKDAWAQYYVRFIQEMEKRGLDVDMLSVQNEPAAVQTWSPKPAWKFTFS